MPFPFYACPVCQKPLEKIERRWLCIDNHSFDCHKKGYVNLLLAQNKRSKSPGDDAEMIASRRRFLEAEHYLPLANRLAELHQQKLEINAQLLDAGCGEGFYTHLISTLNSSFKCVGLDISKPAISAASKYKTIDWCVASSVNLPFVHDQFDSILSVFSRVDSEPFYHALKANGTVCLVTPDHDHLLGLRSLIYEQIRDYDTQKHDDYLDGRFEKIHEERLEVPINLANKQAIHDLLGMTPHAHRLSSYAREQLEATEQLQDTACFKIYWFQKK